MEIRNLYKVKYRSNNKKNETINGKSFWFTFGWLIKDSGEKAMISNDAFYPNDAPKWISLNDLVLIV